ncbi:uncharacterized protein RSE6_01822 [Rhynchosporium secalis]|uniref:Uncharacterized protein n=1 Tax=Rhynchosporium secalis TaxID=38038 RepID=A0A1E1LYR6_RHYSE|nr:uncharacterized protein RSE6_01822 [Rhynchosporium secalis]
MKKNWELSLPRRSTRGPLDMADSPITPSSPTTNTNTLSTPSTPTINRNPSFHLSPTHSQHRSPRLPSSGPGSNLSNLTLASSPSFRTAKTTLSPSRSNMSTSAITSKDFSFLLRPELYHPLTLLDVPPPFRASGGQVDPSTPLDVLLSTGHFRAAAIKAASLLTSSNPPLSPSDHVQIFYLVYTRLASLTLCNQTTLAAQEVKALEGLNSAYYRDEATGKHLVAWDLRVLAVRLQGMGFNDARRGVVGYYDLAREARLTLTALKRSKSAEKQKGEEEEGRVEELEKEIQLWTHRLAELGIRVASALIEMDDLEGATRFLSTLKPNYDSDSESTSTSPGSRLSIQRALLWLCVGDVDAARACVGEASGIGSGEGNEREVIIALAAMADSEFSQAVELWRSLIDSSDDDDGEKAMWRQNLGVCYLYLGRMDEVRFPSTSSQFFIPHPLARTILESLISTSHSFHALTFNLSTIYELCTERSRALKIGLAEKVAGMQNEMLGEGTMDGVGEGMGIGGGGVGKGGWEKVNGDFKL